MAPRAPAALEQAAGAAGAGAGVGKADGAVAAAEPPVVESLGVPYAELSVGDVYCWLAGNPYPYPYPYPCPTPTPTPTPTTTPTPTRSTSP